MLKKGVAVPTDAELKAFGKEHLTAYQVPVRWKIVEDVPRTPSMKPSLPGVREMFISAESEPVQP